MDMNTLNISATLNVFKLITRPALCLPHPQEHFQRLKDAYPGRRLLVVSNTAGALSLDTSGDLASAVEKSTGIHVLPHSSKKPGCGPDIMSYFLSHPETGVTKPQQIAIVGDRLTTDVMMANLMGSYAVWVKNGVVPVEETSVFARLEQRFAGFLQRKGYEAPKPISSFEE
ncbi:mitochondrial PGP phosphatase-domain-containing protein [Bisporella sp. PMI_857]|nr:mitochondrial PGP phosphatase-domain-containing protein [Bisporella sp. PMI_857]KAH8600466.1 mitochondrial PGP phosphatase-domain-containing protein [Bisporella sp. PMI_857]